MQIEFAPEVALLLETITVQTRGMEFSGFGFVEPHKDTNTFYVYEFVLIDVGTSGWTEMDTSKYVHLLNRPDADNMKLWIHRHPVGNGIPGSHNWSGTDNNTCRFEPLGVPHGMQDSVRWALAAVRTPLGWVGRYDTFGKAGKTFHIPVVPSVALEVSRAVDAINVEKINKITYPYLRKNAPVVDWLDNFEPFEDEDDRNYWLEEARAAAETEEEEEDTMRSYFWGEW
jgi:hypothetical protein